MAKAPKRQVSSDASVKGDRINSFAGAEQGGNANQQGVPFKLPLPGILYYDAYVDGQKYQTAQIDWIVEGNSYRLYINIPYAFVGPFIFESRGTVDSYGIAPVIYWSQRGTRTPRYSRFDRNGDGVIDPDVISFNILGGGVHTISPASALPTITDPVIIDGYTQPGATPNTNAIDDSDPTKRG